MDTLQQPKRAARDFKMTDEEAKRFSEQMKNPEFRGLLEEYMKEISDPTNKAENDKYLRQMESEGQAPEGQQLMQPEPAWVIKVKSKASSSSADSTSAAPKKVFINVCHSKMVKEDCYEDAVGPNGAKGRRLMMPYAVGERRFAKDNTGACIICVCGCSMFLDDT
jgi:dynein assembly factor 2